ncbi:hypothetical protein QR680_005602 [Steinernema hermaphroditum]|uniref:C-type lectin domain-containing protein n=1 Tax=Steinernema hermaphroditum TaxID=289476 RepID=A0AA39HUU9_9BILA|nr:hypothetical protein QR680_005602 [Steinernema hermaphroditum]
MRRWTTLSLLLAIFLLTEALVCPEKWTFFDGKCWFYSTRSERWPEARDECRLRYGSDLAVISGERDDNFVNYLAFRADRLLQFDEGKAPSESECFERTPGFVLLGSAVVSPGDVRSATECAEHCLHSTPRFAFVCKSAIWFEKTKECVLNDAAAAESPELFVKNSDSGKSVEYFENKCFDAIPVEEGPSVVGREEIRMLPGVRNCFDKFKHSSLVGFADTVVENVTEKECLSKCWRCEKCLLGKRCKSVVYYRGARECILLSRNRRGNSEAMNPLERGADFFERRRECLPENCADMEVDVVFVLDGSQSVGADRFNRSVAWVSEIVEAINEATEFWNAAVVQVGDSPVLDYDVPMDSFESLAVFRRNLSTVGWKRMPKSALGFAARRIVADWRNIRPNVDLTWVVFLTDGVTSDLVTTEYELMKNNRNLSIYAIGNSEFVDESTLRALATSERHVVANGTLDDVLKLFSRDICSEESLEKMRPHQDRPLFPNTSENAIFSDDPKPSTRHQGVWLGLRRGSYGTLEWVNASPLSEDYVKPIAKHLEILPENGECVLREEEKMWHLEDCSEKHEFVCSMTPLQNINDKLRNSFQ